MVMGNSKTAAHGQRELPKEGKQSKTCVTPLYLNDIMMARHLNGQIHQCTQLAAIMG